MTADSFQVFVAAGPRIYAWRRGTELQQVYSGQGETVTTLLTFGPKLVSVDTSSQCVGHLRRHGHQPPILGPGQQIPRVQHRHGLPQPRPRGHVLHPVRSAPRHLPSRRQPHAQAPGVRLGHREPQPADRDGGQRGHRQVQVWQAAEQARAQGRGQLRPSELVL